MDPNDTPAAPPAESPAADPAPAPTPDPAPEPDLAAEVLAAMDKGVDEATPQADPVDPPDPEPAAEPQPEGEPGADPLPGTPEAAAAEAAKKEAADKATNPEPDKETEDEIKALGLKERSADRFRAMAAEIKELAPLKEQLEKIGIKDVAELPKLAQHAKDGADLVQMVQDTGADSEQFGKTLDYLSLVSAAAKGDRAAAEKAYEVVSGELAALAKALGKEVPGVHDPLAEHADLQKAIQDGDMTKQAALEVVRARNVQAAQAQFSQQTQAQQQAEQQQAARMQQGVTSLVEWEKAQVAKDLAYMEKRAALSEKVKAIRQQFPPEQWVSATELAYQAIAAAQPAPRPAAASPVRASGPRPVMTPAAFENPMDAMDAGIKAASVG